MTPKEKAKDLVEKYGALTDECDCLEWHCICFDMSDYKAKECAIIAVDEILMALHEYDENTELMIKESSYQLQNMERDWNYWTVVKQEISNL